VIIGNRLWLALLIANMFLRSGPNAYLQTHFQIPEKYPGSQFVPQFHLYNGLKQIIINKIFECKSQIKPKLIGYLILGKRQLLLKPQLPQKYNLFHNLIYSFEFRLKHISTTYSLSCIKNYYLLRK